MNHFYNAAEIKDMLALDSIQAAEKVIEELNEDIHMLDLWTIIDRVHATHFHEKYPGILIRIPDEPKFLISEKTQQEMLHFFMRTPAPRLEKETTDNETS